MFMESNASICYTPEQLIEKQAMNDGEETLQDRDDALHTKVVPCICVMFVFSFFDTLVQSTFSLFLVLAVLGGSGRSVRVLQHQI